MKRSRLDIMVDAAYEAMRGSLDGAFREAVSTQVGHEDWPGDVDPPAEIAFEDSLRSVLRQLIRNGLDDDELEEAES